jgi:hypothetical protein
MKPTLPAVSPRPVCRMVRTCNAVFSTRSARHLAACADCRAYFASVQELDVTLREAATQISRETPAASTGFERRIMHAVREAASEAAPARAERRSHWARGLALASVAAIAALVFTRQSWLPRSDDSAQFANDAAVLVDAVESLSTRLTDSVIPSAGQLVAQNPMQDELGSVYADVRSAIDFLAFNFLPSKNLAAVSPSPATRRI